MKILRLILILVLIFILPKSIFAKQYKTTLYFTKDKVIIDGNTVQFLDNKNSNIYPLKYNGDIYLPIRPIADYFGKNIKWNEKERTIYIYGNKPKAKSKSFVPLKEDTEVEVTINDNVRLFIDNLEIIPENSPYLTDNMTEVIFLENNIYINMNALLGTLISNKFEFTKDDILNFTSNDDISSYDYTIYKNLYKLANVVKYDEIENINQIYNDFLKIKNIPIPKEHINFKLLTNEFSKLDNFLKNLEDLPYYKLKYLVYLIERIMEICSGNDLLNIEKNLYIINADYIFYKIKILEFESIQILQNVEKDINNLKINIPEILKDDKEEISSYLDSILLKIDNIKDLYKKLENKNSLTGKEYVETRKKFSNIKRDIENIMFGNFLTKIRGD